MFRLLKFPKPPRIPFFSPFSSIKDRIRKERAERLKFEATAALATRSSDDMKKIRNLGIIAHIDAGKTTTTERMLFYSGALSEPGEVHEGNTVMDYLEQERERGITIRAAAISFHWEGYHLNLIDTPGHIDFTGEVERSLKVLDGAVAIFDAVAGVQAQSEMVWFQANKFEVPRLAFINKMDRPGASLEFTLQTIRKKLNVTPLVIQMPVGESERFQAVIDVLKLEMISWSDKLGCIVERTPISEDHRFYKESIAYKEKLLESLSLFDDHIAERYLNGETLSEEEIRSSIKKILNNNPNKVCVVLVGSALKNKGIQPLLEAIIDFLPSPEEKSPKVSLLDPRVTRAPSKTEKLLAYAYKIVNDKQKGSLVYLRLYSGRIQHRTALFNVTRSQAEKPHHIYRVRANEYVNLTEVTAGDIVAISGLKSTQSGDTLVDNNDERFLLEEIQMPEPVFFAALEYEYARDKGKLENALKDICKEDSSLVISHNIKNILIYFEKIVKEDIESGQILVSGLGELHLEILRDRLLIDYGLRTTLSKFRISYRESIANTATKKIEIHKMMTGRPLYAYIELEVLPNLPTDSHSHPSPSQPNTTNSQSSPSLDNPEINTNVVELAFQRNQRFDEYYEEFKKRKSESKRKRKKGYSWSDEPDDNLVVKTTPDSNAVAAKMVFNPNTPEEIEEIEDEYGEDSIYSISSIPFEILWNVEKTIENSFLRGALLGSPMMNVKVRILDMRYSIRRSNPMIFQMATVDLMKELCTMAEPQILEPVMDFEISSPNPMVQTILNDIINARRGRVGDIVKEGNKFNKEEEGQRSLLYAVMPLESSIGYATYLRTLTKGEGSFIMKFKKYEAVGALRQKDLIENPP